jgi:lysophospholipase L1-like esterase
MRGIEFGRLRGKGVITLADAEQYFDSQAKLLTDTASVAYKDLQGYLKNYLPNKRKEKEMVEKMDQLQTAIYQVNQPRPHQYQIIKEDDAVAASQAGASPLLFGPGTITNEPAPSAFTDEKELNSRAGMPDFFRKAAAGQSLTVAFIGGSVTQMENKYRNQAARYMKRLLPGNAIRFVNAGVSGSGTDLGACRIDEHVLNYQPDLVFVEFAVNGSYLPGLEGIIRKIRKKNPATDICLLYSIMSGQSELYAKGIVPDNIVRLETVAAYYQLPSIQMGIEPSFLEAQGKLAFKGDANLVKDKIVFSDGIHPTEAGGYIYASAIYRSLKKMKEVHFGQKPALPAPMIVDNWEDAQMLPVSDVKFSEGWTKMATAPDANLKQFSPWFPVVMQSEKPGASFSFSFTGTTIGFFDIGGPEVGQLDIIVDGKKLKPLNRFNGWCNNRYRGQFDFVQVGEGTHQVTCMISDDIPDKKTILGPSKIADITANPAKYNRGVIYLGRILIRGKLI